jgi:hypothetical protein
MESIWYFEDWQAAGVIAAAFVFMTVFGAVAQRVFARHLERSMEETKHDAA